MTKFTITTLLLGFFCFTSLQAEIKSNINFQNITFSEVKTQAASQQKHFFTYIHANWCLGCQIMEETTFTNQKLGQFINDEFLAVKVDIHSALGKEWDEEFQITCLPTFLIFDEHGQLLDRYESTFTGTALQQLLRQSIEPGYVAQTQYGNLSAEYNKKAASGLLTSQSQKKFDNSAISNSGYSSNQPVKTKTSHGSIGHIDTNDQEIVKQHIEQLELLLQKNENSVGQPIEADQSDIRCQELFSNKEEIRSLIDALKAIKDQEQNITPPLKEVVVAATVPFERQTSTVNTTSSENSNSNIKKLYARGAHKIQLGQYKDYDKAASVIKRLQSNFQSKDIFLLIEKKGSYSTYRVLVKGFINQQEASDFITALKDMNFD